MAYPTPSHPPDVAVSNALPTVTLAPPPGLVSSRSFHIAPLAIIPLAISCLICIVTGLYLIKLWQREDKFYVDEADYAGSSEDEETAEEPGHIPLRESRPEIEGKLAAAREEARYGRVSRPFNILVNPRHMQNPARTHGQILVQGPAVPIHMPSPPPLPQPVPISPASATTFSTDDANSIKSTQTWERESIASSNPSIATITQPGPSSPPPTHDSEIPSPDNMLRHSAQSTKSNAESEATDVTADRHGLHRRSRLDWADEEDGSVVGSELTRAGDRGSYVDRFEDY